MGTRPPLCCARIIVNTIRRAPRPSAAFASSLNTIRREAALRPKIHRVQRTVAAVSIEGYGRICTDFGEGGCGSACFFIKKRKATRPGEVRIIVRAAAFQDRHGDLWFGTAQGLARLSPELEADSPPPPVYISAVQAAVISTWPRRQSTRRFRVGCQRPPVAMSSVPTSDATANRCARTDSEDRTA